MRDPQKGDWGLEGWGSGFESFLDVRLRMRVPAGVGSQDPGLEEVGGVGEKSRKARKIENSRSENTFKIAQHDIWTSAYGESATTKIREYF